jgi:hypothetical protein
MVVILLSIRPPRWWVHVERRHPRAHEPRAARGDRRAPRHAPRPQPHLRAVDAAPAPQRTGRALRARQVNARTTAAT